MREKGGCVINHQTDTSGPLAYRSISNCQLTAAISNLHINVSQADLALRGPLNS